MSGGKKDRYTVLVTDADTNNALAIVRCLSKKGYIVYCAGHKKQSMCFFSKYCKKKFIYRNPEDNSDFFVDDLEIIIKNYTIDILLPVSASTTVPVSFHKKRLEKHTLIPISNYETLSKAHNKYTMLKIAKKCGVPSPLTYCPDNLEELKEIAGIIKYPMVLKLRKTSASRGLQYIYSEEELLKKYFSINKSNRTFDFTKPLIQEFIPGEIHDVCMLCDNGKARAALTQKRIWTYPINGGGGIINKTTDEQGLIELANKLTKHLNWDGVTQVEFKIDSRNDTPKLMEMNAKFWGTLELSIAAGIAFPELLCRMATNQYFKDVFEYNKELVFIWINSGLFSNFFQSESFIYSLRLFRRLIKNNYLTNISFDDILPHIFIYRGFLKSMKDTVELM